MKSLKTHKKGFTLIELLTVIAIIGILAGILIPVVGSARTSANKARAKTQLNGYANAIVQYKTEYGYWPPVITKSFKISDNQDDFIIALSGRDEDGNALTGNERNQNRKAIPFYSFSDQEFDLDRTTIVDAFDNPDIYIAVDRDGNGQIDNDDVTSSLPDGAPSPLRAKVVLWTNADPDEDYEEITTWD